MERRYFKMKLTRKIFKGTHPCIGQTARGDCTRKCIVFHNIIAITIPKMKNETKNNKDPRKRKRNDKKTLKVMNFFIQQFYF